MVLKVEATFDNLVLFETVGAVTKKSLLKAINVLPGTDPHKVIVIHGLANLLSICDEQTI
jgi:hypothetical protein